MVEKINVLPVPCVCIFEIEPTNASAAVCTAMLTFIAIPALLTAATVTTYVVLLLRSRNVVVKPAAVTMLFLRSVCLSDDITTW